MESQWNWREHRMNRAGEFGCVFVDTLWLFNIAMEMAHFVPWFMMTYRDLPIKDGDFLQQTVE